MNHCKIGFFGTSDFALKALEKLYNYDATIKFIVSQSPKPSGRGKKVSLSPVGEFAVKKKIKLFTPEKISDANFLSKISSENLDFIIIVAYGKIITEQIIKLPKFYCLNIHGSLLPKWRGAAPIQRALLNGDLETGVSIMIVQKKLDSGPIVLTQKITINTNDNAGTIHNKLAIIGSNLIIEALNKIISKKISLRIQDDNAGTYAKKISKNETRISWSDHVEKIHRQIRAFNPWPGAFTFMKKNKKKIRLKIIESEMLKTKEKKYSFGTCFGELFVQCDQGCLKIKKIQPEGKKIMQTNEFLNGYKPKNFIF